MKILPLEDLANKVKALKESGKTVALCHGVFDLLHVGHIRHLSHAKSIADCLVVTVTNDTNVVKGPGRPVFTEALRAEQIASLEDVDYVAISQDVTAVKALQLIKPDIYVKGGEYKDLQSDLTGNIEKEIKEVEKHGGNIVFTNEIVFSSSNIINTHSDLLSEEAKEYIKFIKEQFSIEDIVDSLDALKGKRILVFGDAIIDEYISTRALGQSGKYNVLSVKKETSERFAGGALAVANHIAQLSDQVSILTGIGPETENREFIDSKISKNVSKELFIFTNSPTLQKIRYVGDDGTRLFELYEYDDNPVCEDLENKICRWLEANIRDFDLVVVPDFGNGLITEKMIKICCDKAANLAVNTQVNSGNRGFHSITKYSRADYVCLNETELRLAVRDQTGDIAAISSWVADALGVRWLAVTRGARGILFYDGQDNSFSSVPAVTSASEVVDRIGAGDAFLAFASSIMLSRQNPALAMFIGSVAAAIDVQIVCNREPVDFARLRSFINTLLK
jgi:rfaE bifunctional protein kinase chain/domain/rfaE bifunctional protein nucleotidyltransferase chain/domain